MVARLSSHLVTLVAVHVPTYVVSFNGNAYKLPGPVASA